MVRGLSMKGAMGGGVGDGVLRYVQQGFRICILG